MTSTESDLLHFIADLMLRGPQFRWQVIQNINRIDPKLSPGFYRYFDKLKVMNNPREWARMIRRDVECSDG